jgi:hypothetical protein
MCARVGNQRSRGVVTARVQTDVVRSLHHQRRDLHQSTYPIPLGRSGLTLLSPDDISERGLISVEILSITTLLVVVERETTFVTPSIEALIRSKTIVGITNEVDILGDCQTVDAHVAYFSALFIRYSGIDHFKMIKARVLKLLHKKINLGGEHVHLFKLVNLACAGLSALLIPALVRGHLLN